MQELIWFPRWDRYFEEEGESANTVWDTVLAAHGEYPPVNQGLQDDAKSEKEAVIVVLKKFRNNCIIFKKLSKLVEECFRADESKDFECLKKVYNKHVQHRIHIFECNGNLRPSVRHVHLQLPLTIKEKLHVTEQLNQITRSLHSRESRLYGPLQCGCI